MMEVASLFTDEELATEGDFAVGTFWRIKHVALDEVSGKVEQRYDTTGMVIGHSVWDNQFRIRYAQEQLERYPEWDVEEGPWRWEVPEPKYEPQIHLYAGRHFNTQGRPIWRSRITSATRLYGADVDELTASWQAWWDEWVWSEEEFRDKTPGFGAFDLDALPWVPRYRHAGEPCPHAHIWRTHVGWSKCKPCGEYVEHDHDAGPCSCEDCLARGKNQHGIFPHQHGRPDLCTCIECKESNDEPVSTDAPVPTDREADA